jgi:prepilin-type N-terminal cleavage/methylation domain-containing protein
LTTPSRRCAPCHPSGGGEFAGRRGRKGFTLVEVIVVLVILAILAAIAIPALTGYIDKAKYAEYKAEARNVFMAAQSLLSETTVRKSSVSGINFEYVDPDGAVIFYSWGDRPSGFTGHIYYGRFTYLGDKNGDKDMYQDSSKFGHDELKKLTGVSYGAMWVVNADTRTVEAYGYNVPSTWLPDKKYYEYSVNYNADFGKWKALPGSGIQVYRRYGKDNGDVERVG